MHGILSDWCKNETTFNYNDYELLVSLNFPRLASKLEKITAQKYIKKKHGSEICLEMSFLVVESRHLVLGLDPTDDFKESAETRFCTLQLVGD